MKIMKKVLIKQIVTEKSKAKLHTAFMESKMRLEQECQQLLFEQRKIQSKKNLPRPEVTRRFQKEISSRKEKIKLIDFKMEQLDTLDPGSEIVEKEVEALVEVKEGASWDKFMKEQAIIIEDDTIIRIDE